MEKRIETLEELAIEAGALVGRLSPTEGSATLVTLSGELGAGKTAFIQAVAQALGVEDSVTSPTFVLEKIYELKNSEFKHLVHIDAYRLENGAELAGLGFDEIMKDNRNVVVLEWPEKVAEALPPVHTSIVFEVLPDNTRKLTYG